MSADPSDLSLHERRGSTEVLTAVAILIVVDLTVVHSGFNVAIGRLNKIGLPVSKTLYEDEATTVELVGLGPQKARCVRRVGTKRRSCC